MKLTKKDIDKNELFTQLIKQDSDIDKYRNEVAKCVRKLSNKNCDIEQELLVMDRVTKLFSNYGTAIKEKNTYLKTLSTVVLALENSMPTNSQGDADKPNADSIMETRKRLLAQLNNGK